MCVRTVSENPANLLQPPIGLLQKKDVLEPPPIERQKDYFSEFFSQHLPFQKYANICKTIIEPSSRKTFATISKSIEQDYWLFVHGKNEFLKEKHYYLSPKHISKITDLAKDIHKNRLLAKPTSEAVEDVSEGASFDELRKMPNDRTEKDFFLLIYLFNAYLYIENPAFNTIDGFYDFLTANTPIVLRKDFVDFILKKNIFFGEISPKSLRELIKNYSNIKIKMIVLLKILYQLNLCYPIHSYIHKTPFPINSEKNSKPISLLLKLAHEGQQEKTITWIGQNRLRLLSMPTIIGGNVSDETIQQIKNLSIKRFDFITHHIMKHSPNQLHMFLQNVDFYNAQKFFPILHKEALTRCLFLLVSTCTSNTNCTNPISMNIPYKDILFLNSHNARQQNTLLKNQNIFSTFIVYENIYASDKIIFWDNKNASDYLQDFTTINGAFSRYWDMCSLMSKKTSHNITTHYLNLIYMEYENFQKEFPAISKKTFLQLQTIITEIHSNKEKEKYFFFMIYACHMPKLVQSRNNFSTNDIIPCLKNIIPEDLQSTFGDFICNECHFSIVSGETSVKKLMQLYQKEDNFIIDINMVILFNILYKNDKSLSPELPFLSDTTLNTFLLLRPSSNARTDRITLRENRLKLLCLPHCSNEKTFSLRRNNAFEQRFLLLKTALDKYDKKSTDIINLFLEYIDLENSNQFFFLLSTNAIVRFLKLSATLCFAPAPPTLDRPNVERYKLLFKKVSINSSLPIFDFNQSLINPQISDERIIRSFSRKDSNHILWK